MFHETAFHGTVFQKIGFDLEGSAACSASVRAAFSVKHMLYLELGFFRLFLVLFFFLTWTKYQLWRSANCCLSKIIFDALFILPIEMLAITLQIRKPGEYTEPQCYGFLSWQMYAWRSSIFARHIENRKILQLIFFYLLIYFMSSRSRIQSLRIQFKKKSTFKFYF